MSHRFWGNLLRKFQVFVRTFATEVLYNEGSLILIMYNKEFDIWNEKKKLVDKKASSSSLYFHEREVWWCTVGVNIGVEVDGKNRDFERPVLVIKKFNDHMFWGVPLTSKIKSYSYFIRVNHEKGTSFANLAQLRMFSSKRTRRKVTTLTEKSFSEVLEKIKSWL